MVARNGDVNGADADEKDVLSADTALADSEELIDTQVLDADDSEDTGIFNAETELSDNVGMSSVQFDVDELITEVEAEAPSGVDQDGRLRKRLEAIAERKRRQEALEDFDDYDLDI